METKANYTLIGLFTVLGFAGILAFVLWFARIELDRQFAYYDIRFTSVSGLNTASDVRFAGLPVGQVVDVRFSPDRDGTITVRIEVVAETPIRSDSVATIEAQGVTGVSFVSIGPGTPDAPLLDGAAGQEVPEIQSGRSMIQSLSEDAPALVSETLQVVQDVGDLFRGENAGRVERILLNAERASDDFAIALDALGGVAETVDDFSEQVQRFNATLESLVGDFSVVLETTNDTLESIDLLADQATGIVAAGTNTLAAFEGTVIEAERYFAEDLTALTTDAQDTLSDTRAQIAALSTDASALMQRFGETATVATARLQEVEGTVTQVEALIATLDTAAAAVEGAATRLDTVIVGEGAPLLAESRAAVAAASDAIAAVSRTAQEDLPEIMTGIRDAVEEARAVIDRTGRNLSGATDGLPALVETAEATLSQVTETFVDANDTLSSINRALEIGERTLDAAQSAFTGADRVINEEIGELIDRLETTVSELNVAIGAVSADLPAISDDVRGAAGAASEAFDALEALVAQAGPDVATFTARGLPLYAQLAQETRALVANLERLTQRIARNPTQFLLDRDLPEFRR